MDLNTVNFVGQIRKYSLRDAPWGGHTLSALITLPDTHLVLPTGEHILRNQATWLNIGIPSRNNVEDMDKVEAFCRRVDGGLNMASIVDATFTSYVNKKTGQTIGQVKANLNSINLRRAPVESQLNITLLTGRVKKIYDNVFELESTYSNPKGKTPQEKWPTRSIPVMILDRNVGLQEDRRLFVYGRLASCDATGNEYLHVIPQEIV